MADSNTWGKRDWGRRSLGILRDLVESKLKFELDGQHDDLRVVSSVAVQAGSRIDDLITSEPESNRRSKSVSLLKFSVLKVEVEHFKTNDPNVPKVVLLTELFLMYRNSTQLFNCRRSPGWNPVRTTHPSPEPLRSFTRMIRVRVSSRSNNHRSRHTYITQLSASTGTH